MSIAALTWAIAQQLKPTQKLVLLVLAHRHHQETGQCNPSLSTLKADTGLSRSAIKKALCDLVALEFVRVKPRKMAGCDRSNQHDLLFENGVCGKQKVALPNAEEGRQPAPRRGREPTGPEGDPTGPGTGLNREGEKENLVGGGGGHARDLSISEDTARFSPRKGRDDRNPDASLHTLRDHVLEAAGIDVAKSPNPARWLGPESLHTIRQWTGLGLTDGEILEQVRAVRAGKRDGPPSALNYFDQPMRRAAGRKAEPALTPIGGGRSQDRRIDVTKTLGVKP